MRVLVVTDAWRPQVNGVVRSLEALAREAPALGAEVVLLTPEGFPGLPLPGYPGIRLALPSPRVVARRIAAVAPDAVHIATEGPLGWVARRHCLRAGLPFTTSYHTRFPEYLRARAPVPEALTWAVLRRFHNAGAGTMCATPTLEAELRGRGFARLMRWSRGVDADLFRPGAAPDPGVAALAPPVLLFVGRVAVEKNLDAFLSLDLPGTKVVVGEGPALADLRARHPAAHFLGLREGEGLAAVYAAADAFVFPSRTDTFGIVLLEAMAAGLPVAAFPVPGPLDVVTDPGAGVLDADLGAAVRGALALGRAAPRAHALRFTWRASAAQFLANVVTARGAAPAGASITLAVGA